jgi:LmbE family N-acetylglucosaminyl deacetylase
MLDLVQSVETVLADLRPEVVFTHNPYCLNVDHRLTAQAVMTATRPGTSSVRAVYAFETPSATEWAFGALGVFVPTLFYTLTLAQIQRKEDALKCYDTEGRRWPHPRSVSKLSAQASTHGGAVAAAFAERFMVLREIR